MSGSNTPGAVTVAVTSGKGGVGKTTTAVTLATTLAARGLDVVVIDADIDGPNVHLVAEMDSHTVGLDPAGLCLRLPTSPHGFRVATPVTVWDTAEKEVRVGVSDLVGMVQFATPPQVVIFDLPPGFTEAHEAVARDLPDLIVTVVAPTYPSMADHTRHLAAWDEEWQRVLRARRDADKRRKLTLPEKPTTVTVETMARLSGIPEGGTEPVMVRRTDAVAADEVAALVGPDLSLPAAADIPAAASSPEAAKLADRVAALLPG